MELKIKKNNERALALVIFALFFLALGSVIVSIKLAMTNKDLTNEAINSRQIIVTPLFNPTAQEYSFTGERGDSRYLRLMALSFIHLRLDVNAQNVEQNHEILISHTANELREKLIPILSQEKRVLSQDNGSSVFYPTKIQVSPSNGIVDVYGDLIFSYGIRRTNPVSKYYRLRLETRNGQLALTDFTELTNEKN